MGHDSNINGPCYFSILAVYLFTTLFLCNVVFITSEDIVPPVVDAEAEALLKFKDSLENSISLNSWTRGTHPCNQTISNWEGALCSGGKVWGLKLESMGLKGKIDVDALLGLPELITISIMNNNLEGSLPDIGKLTLLKTVYLSHNKFSGQVPADAFSKMTLLKKLYISENQLEGPIPQSLTALPKLVELNLEGNKFQGSLPVFEQRKWHSFNVANNKLEGQIPEGLSKMDARSFVGNKNLCGTPLPSCSQEKSPSLSSSSVLKIIIIVVAVVTVLIIIFIVAFFLIKQDRREPMDSIEAPRSTLKETATRQFEAPATSIVQRSTDSFTKRRGNGSGSGKKADRLKLSFVRDEKDRFDMQDLLKASAEILGSGCFGGSYKADMPSGPTVVVKRFKKMNNVGREDFEEHMRRIGSLRHTNLLPLVAYYYKKEEKLLITDFIQKGSLEVHLHDHQAIEQPSLDFVTRLKIVKGVASGLKFLYKELPSLTAPHGHLKSSNVLINDNFEPLLSDYALIPLTNKVRAQDVIVAYKSPEYAQQGRITKKTDVWCLGMLILEILTGRLPTKLLQQGRISSDEGDLANWVNSFPEEEWGSKVFDKELRGKKKCEGQMLKLLKIGMTCCEDDVDKRPDIKEAVEKIDELKEKDTDEDFFSACASEREIKTTGLFDNYICIG